jgi:hypothetical protein
MSNEEMIQNIYFKMLEINFEEIDINFTQEEIEFIKTLEKK